LRSELTEGAIVADRFVLVGRLGAGGMGTVWSARHRITGKLVALKFLKPELCSPAHRRRFEREARAACTVNHPNIREVHDFLEDDGTPVMVLEHLSGESLASRLARDERLDVRTTAKYLTPVVSAVGTAHAAGIVHRDLKPENLFLLDDGGVKVLDFGIAKLGAESEREELTASGAMLGSPAYMSPEQVFGEKDVDHRADVWALGIIVYQCLSGVLPTRADNVGQVIKTIVAREIAPIEQLVPDLPEDVADIVGRMLSRAREDRPEDLREVLEILVRHGGVDAPRFEASVPAVTDSVEQPAPIRRSGGVETRTSMATESGTSRHALETPPPRRPRLAVGALAAGVVGVLGWLAWPRTPVPSSAVDATAAIPQADPPSSASAEAPAAVPSPTPTAAPPAPAASSAKVTQPRAVGSSVSRRPVASGAPTVDPLGDRR
jgi:serine/threonine-protein kinase